MVILVLIWAKKIKRYVKEITFHFGHTNSTISSSKDVSISLDFKHTQVLLVMWVLGLVFLLLVVFGSRPVALKLSLESLQMTTFFHSKWGLSENDVILVNNLSFETKKSFWWRLERSRAKQKINNNPALMWARNEYWMWKKCPFHFWPLAS